MHLPARWILLALFVSATLARADVELAPTFTSCAADSGWRPNDGKPSEYDYDVVMADHGGVGYDAFIQNLADQMANKEN